LEQEKLNDPDAPIEQAKEKVYKQILEEKMKA
jgi:hypothetical protein